VKNMKQYADETDTDRQEEMQKGLYAQWTEYMLMKNSDHNKDKQWALSTKDDSILLDNGSMLSLFGNPNMVTNIRESKTTLELATTLYPRCYQIFLKNGKLRNFFFQQFR
jgi:hypothetical protein